MLLNRQKIEEIVIPSSVTDINESAFYRCENLASVSFEEGSLLNKIGENTFRDTAITEIVLPASLTGIDAFAFFNTTALSSVGFEDGSMLNSIDDYAFSYLNLTEISFPPSLTFIGNNAVSNNPNLTSVIFKGVSELTSIGSNAFQETTITRIAIPSKVVSIGTNALDIPILTQLYFDCDYSHSFEGMLDYGIPDSVNILYSPNATGWEIVSNAKVRKIEDINIDEVVNSLDLIEIASLDNYNKAAVDSLNSLCDVNGDGRINFNDLVFVRKSKNLVMQIQPTE